MERTEELPRPAAGVGPGGPSGPAPQAPTPIQTPTPIEVPPVADMADTAPSAPTEESSPAGGTGDEYPIFLIIPSAFSYLFSVIIILILFLLYMISIGTIASFQSKFTPNFYMLWDFITTGNTKQYQQEFQDYLNNMVLTSQNASNQISNMSLKSQTKPPEGFSGSRHLSSLGNKFASSFQEIVNRVNEIFSHFFTEIRAIWNQLLLNTLLDGNTIKVSRKL